MVLNSKACKKIIFIQLAFIFVIQFFIDQFNLPSAVGLLSDVLNAILCLYMILTPKNILVQVEAKTLKVLLLILVGFLVIGALMNFVMPQYFFWGCRKYLRGFLFFIACIRFLDYEDYERILEFSFWIQLINIAISFYQFFVLGLNQDHLGGLFGTAEGCNGYSNIFFCILLAYFLSKFIYEKKYLSKMLIIVFSTMLLSAIAEIKFFYIEFVAIIFLEVVLAKFNLKKLLIIMVSVVSLVIGMVIMKSLFPAFYARMTNIMDIISIGYDVGGGYNISRLGAFTEVNNLFLTTPFQRLLGLGLGGCETGPLSFLISPFYKQYGQYNYIFFGHTITYLETGVIGIILLIMIYGYFFVYPLRTAKKCDKKFSPEFVFIETFACIIMGNIIYNNFIREEIQYIVYFVLALPFVIRKKQISEAISQTKE